MRILHGVIVQGRAKSYKRVFNETLDETAESSVVSQKYR
jgi:hypothetical protein